MEVHHLGLGTYYVAGLLLATILPLIFALMAHLLRLCRIYLSCFLQRYIHYPASNHSIHGSRPRIFLALSSLAVNIACIVTGTQNIHELNIRAAQLALANLIWLLCIPGPQLTDLLGISLGHFRWLHGCIGMITFLQGILHACLIISGTDNRFTFDATGKTGTTVGSWNVMSLSGVLIKRGRLSLHY